MQLVPVLIGAFAGAPLLARELETGTYRYAWTQGFGRERQAIAKLALVGVTLAVLAGAFGELFAWFFQPFLYMEQMNVLTETVFDARGLVFPAFTLAAFAIGAFFGMLLRRIIPAMAATLGVYLALRLAAWGVRKYYPVAVVTSNTKIFSQFETPSLPGYPWILSTWVTGPGGQPASQSVANQILNGPGPNARASLLNGLGPSTGASVPPGYTSGPDGSRSATSGPCSSSRPAGCSSSRSRSSPRPSRWSAAGRPRPGGWRQADGDNLMTVFTRSVRPVRPARGVRPVRPAGRPGRAGPPAPNRGRCRGRECCGSPGGSTAAC